MVKILKLVFNSLFTVIGWISSAFALWQLHYSTTVSVRYIIFCFVIGFISLIYVGVQIHTYIHDRKKVFVHSTPEKVHAYLYKRIKDGGRTVIFTRDFTWANCNIEMLALLKAKAAANELIVCLYKPTHITEELKALGAEIYTHNLHNLKSRFTITHYGTNSPQITVGSRTANGNFVNERYDMQSNPNMYNIFVELFESAKATVCK